MSHKNRKNITGQTFGKLQVIEEFSVPYKGTMENRKTVPKCRCKCQCGEIVEIWRSNLLGGKTIKCRLCQNRKVEIGEKYGNLTVINHNYKIKFCYKCECECGDMDWYCPRYLLRAKRPPKCKYCRCPKKYKTKLTKEEHLELLRKRSQDKHEKTVKILEGKKFKYLKVIRLSHYSQRKSNSKWKRSHYLCECLACKKEFTVRGDYIPYSIGCGCIKGKLCSEAIKNKKFTNQEILMIRELFQLKIYTQRQLAKMFDCTETHMSSIVNNKLYQYAE